MAAPAQVDVWVGLDAGKGEHLAELAAELDRVHGRRDALATEIEEAFLARRRCDVILAMLRSRQPYQPARPAPGLAPAA